jgi:hypothetical protein
MLKEGKMLFFKSGKKGREEKLSTVFSRPLRYECLSTVRVNGYEGQAVLRNISDTGFRMESKTFVEIETGANYLVSISPEVFMGIKSFDVTVEVRWILSSPEKFSIGFMVTQNNPAFKRYVEYLRSQAKKAG